MIFLIDSVGPQTHNSEEDALTQSNQNPQTEI